MGSWLNFVVIWRCARGKFKLIRKLYAPVTLDTLALVCDELRHQYPGAFLVNRQYPRWDKFLTMKEGDTYE